MKINPLEILLNQNYNFNKKFYFISGNEKTLMEKINYKIIQNYKRVEKVTVERLDSILDYVDEIGLFENKKIFLVKNCSSLDEKTLNKIRESESVFIFAQENSPKIKKIKNIFIKDKDTYLFDCYELDRASKIKLLNEFIRLSEINFGKNLYWFLVEKLDSRYVFFENSLNKILELEQKEITLNNIKKILTINDNGKEKIFFNILKKNKEIIEIYRDKIVTISDVNDFYFYTKYLCQLIIDCSNESEYDKKIPTYLFKEKSFLIDIFRKYNSKKKKLLLSLLSSTEKSLRKHGGLSLISGLRFVLNIKKITIS
tara:strand:- start:1698 stop:2636 length:939 start_codon:yes stop_codon:yes gene_type:complete